MASILSRKYIINIIIHTMSHKISWIIVIVLIAGFSLWAFTRTPHTTTPPPRDYSTQGWHTATTTASGFAFQFPADLGTKYITPTDWPPVLNIDPHAFSCTEAGVETQQAGQTAQKVINGHTYCITRESEGAAGSIYTQYAYARGRGNTTAILTFSMRLVQCGNYDEPKKSECDAERTAFDAHLNSTVDQIFETIK
jgi:hypothetical protein